jgi:hypothetical protein
VHISKRAGDQLQGSFKILNESKIGELMKKRIVWLLLVVLLIVTGIPVYAHDDDSRDISQEFVDTIEMLVEDEYIPSDEGDYYFMDDFTEEWAQMYWYQWYQVRKDIGNFVVRTNISWESASNTPQWSDSGCGFVFREIDANNHMKANLALDGYVYINGYRNGNFLSYGKRSYASHSTKGEAEFVLVVNEYTVNVFIDGKLIHTARDIAMDDPGMLAYVVVSGTNKDYGTRCTFKDMEFFVFEH